MVRGRGRGTTRSRDTQRGDRLSFSHKGSTVASSLVPPRHPPPSNDRLISTPPLMGVPNTPHLATHDSVIASPSSNDGDHGPTIQTIGSSNSPLRDATGRLFIFPSGKFLMPSSEASAIARSCFLLKVDDHGYKWKYVSRENKRFYFEEFKKLCYWDASIPEEVIYHYWKSKAGKRYNAYLGKLRKTREKPAHFMEEQWLYYTTMWDTKDFKAIHKQASANGNTGQGTMLHTGGSISFIEHQQRLSKELGHDAQPFEVLVRTHTEKGDGVQFINDKSRDIYHRHCASKEQLMQSNESGSMASVNGIAFFYEKVGEKDKKQQVHGLGLTTSSYCPSVYSFSFTSSGFKTQQTKQLMEQCDQLKAQLDEAMAEIQRRVEAEERVRDELRQRVQAEENLREELRQQNSLLLQLCNHVGFSTDLSQCPPSGSSSGNLPPSLAP